VCASAVLARLSVAASIFPFDDRSMHTTGPNVLHGRILTVLSRVYRQFVEAQDLSLVAGSLYRSGAPFSSRRRAAVFCRSRLLYYSYHHLIEQIRQLQMKLFYRPYGLLIRRTCCRTTCCELGIRHLLVTLDERENNSHFSFQKLPPSSPVQALNFVKIGNLHGGDKFVVITLDLFGTWDTTKADKGAVSFTL
jgi:hypothetical protein